jgi:hypothetical protein
MTTITLTFIEKPQNILCNTNHEIYLPFVENVMNDLNLQCNDRSEIIHYRPGIITMPTQEFFIYRVYIFDCPAIRVDVSQVYETCLWTVQIYQTSASKTTKYALAVDLLCENLRISFKHEIKWIQRKHAVLFMESYEQYSSTPTLESLVTFLLNAYVFKEIISYI